MLLYVIGLPVVRRYAQPIAYHRFKKLARPV